MTVEWKPYPKPPGLTDQEYFDLHCEYIERDKTGYRVRMEEMYCKLHPVYFWQAYYWITNKQEKNQLFSLNDVQKQFRAESTNFDIILKARKLGFSTLSIAEMFHETNFCQNVSGGVVTHLIDASQDMVKKVEFAHNKLPDFMKLSLDTKNKNEILFKETNSKIKIYTAGSGGGRSKDIGFLLLSEAAWYSSLSEVMTGIGQSLTDNARVRIETTANGYNELKDYWDNAVLGVNEYRPHFFGVFDSVQNQIPIEPEEDTTEYDLIAALHNTKPTYAKYYISKMKKLNNDKTKIKQEHPITATEAFIFSGDCYFEVERVKADIDLLRQKNVQPLRLEKNGNVRIYKDPVPMREYVMGMDPADGGGDDSVFHIEDILTGEQMAVCQSEWRWEVLTDTGIEYCIRYNMALFGCERNNHGHAALERATSTHNYPHIYEHEEFDKTTKLKTRRKGFPTSATTKPAACGLLSTAYDNSDVIIYDINMLMQFMTFTNELKATPGKHDDLVMAIAIAQHVKKYGLKFVRSTL